MSHSILSIQRHRNKYCSICKINNHNTHECRRNTQQRGQFSKPNHPSQQVRPPFGQQKQPYKQNNFRNSNDNKKFDNNKFDNNKFDNNKFDNNKFDNNKCGKYNNNNRR